MKLKDINKKWIEETNKLSLLEKALDVLNVNVSKRNLIPIIKEKIFLLKEKENLEFDNLLKNISIDGDSNNKNFLKLEKSISNQKQNLQTYKSGAQELGLLLGFNFINYSEERNELLKLWIEILLDRKVTNKQKITYIRDFVNFSVDNLYKAILNDAYPQKDIEQIFGMKGDTVIKDTKDIPVDRSVIGAWNKVLSEKFLDKSQIENALLNGNLPNIFELALKKYVERHPEESNYYCSNVLKKFSQIQWDSDIHKIINDIYKLPNYEVTQFRQIISQGFWEVAYGFDKTTGFFFCVYDNNTKYDGENSKEIKKIFESIDMIGDGAGCYISLHTGGTGFGRKVSPKDIKTIWEKYGVEKKYLDLIN